MKQGNTQPDPAGRSNAPVAKQWNSKPLTAGSRTYTGKPVSAAVAAEWQRLTDLIKAARHPAARAYLVDRRHRLIQRALA